MWRPLQLFFWVSLALTNRVGAWGAPLPICQPVGRHDADAGQPVNAPRRGLGLGAESGETALSVAHRSARSLATATSCFLSHSAARAMTWQ
jgi:hypothetical protein